MIILLLQQGTVRSVRLRIVPVWKVTTAKPAVLKKEMENRINPA